VANKAYYYSRAENFKHLCNIMQKQLLTDRFRRPSGFDNWKSLVSKSSAFNKNQFVPINQPKIKNKGVSKNGH
jgi:hypothetical protein